MKANLTCEQKSYTKKNSAETDYTKEPQDRMRASILLRLPYLLRKYGAWVMVPNLKQILARMRASMVTNLQQSLCWFMVTNLKHILARMNESKYGNNKVYDKIYATNADKFTLLIQYTNLKKVMTVLLLNMLTN